MPPRNLVSSLAAPVVLVALCLAAACGGGSSSSTNNHSGQLTDPQNVPTATPWQTPPDVVVLDPSNIKPLPPNEPNAGPTDTPAPGQPGVCGQTYTVVAGDTTYGIAAKCGVGPQAIIDANPGINPSALSIGQVLIMPAPATASLTPVPTDTPAPTDTPGQ
jgi:LysM repeat protein